MDFITLPDDYAHESQLDHEIQIRLNSPRLREACRKQGINVNELKRKSFDQIRQMHSRENFSRANLIMIAKHYEERRQAKLNIVFKERNKMIEGEIDDLMTRKEFSNKGVTTTVRHASQPNIDDDSKARLELGEYLMKQMEEVNDKEIKEIEEENEIQVDNKYERAMNNYKKQAKEELVKQSTVRAHLGNKADRGTIELIDEKEFTYQHNVDRMMRKASAKKQAARTRSIKTRNHNVYQREITAFMEYELNARKKDYFHEMAVGNKRYQRDLMKSRVTAMQKKDRMNPGEKAKKAYFEEQLRMQQEAENLHKRDMDSVIKHARQTSKKFMDKVAPVLLKGARMQEYVSQSPRVPTKDLKKSIRENPTAYARMARQSLYEEHGVYDQEEQGIVNEEEYDLRDLSLDNIKANPNATYRYQTKTDVSRRRLLLGYHHDPYRMAHGELGSAYRYYPEVLNYSPRSPRQEVQIVPERADRYTSLSSRQVSSPSNEFARNKAFEFPKKNPSGKTSLFTSPEKGFRKTAETDFFVEI